MTFSFSLTRSKPNLEQLPKAQGLILGNAPVKPEFAEHIRSLNQKMFRSYDAAITTGLNADFRSTFGSANAEILTSLYLSRGRARTLVKDFTTAKAMQRSMQNNVVGHKPFQLKMQYGKYVDGKFELDIDVNRMIEKEWEIAGLPENFSVRKDMSRMEGYRIIEASAFRDGSILARHWRDYPDNRYNYAIDLLEADRLQESYMGKAPNGNTIRFSIERNQWQAPVAYWLLTRHPGDVFGTEGAYFGVGPNNWRERVDAKDIIHYNNLRDRAEQDIGFTELDASIQALHRNRQYDISLVYAAIASCCKPFWIKKEFPTGMNYTPEMLEQMMNQVQTGPYLNGNPGIGTGQANQNPTTTQRGIGTRTDSLTPAQTQEFDYGQSLQQIDPKFPIEAASEFRKDNLRDAANGCGLAYQTASGDYQNLGFSASRQSELPQRDWFKIRQEHMIMNFVRKHFNEWLKSAILCGRLALDITELENYQLAATFQGRRWDYLNPLPDVQADILAMEANIKSPQQIQAEMEDGLPLDTLYSEIEEAEVLRDLHGIVSAEELAAQSTAPTVDSTERGGNADIPPKKGGKQTLKRSRGISRTTMQLIEMQGDGRNGYRH